MACKVALFRNAEIFSSCVQNRVESSVDYALRPYVHPASGRHLSVVGHAHFFGYFPVVQVVIHAHHHGVGDHHSRSLRLRWEQSQRMSRLYDQCLFFGQFLQVFFYHSVLQPVLAHLACLSVRNQLVRVERHVEVQIVVYHDLKSLACETLALVLVYRLSVYLSGRSVSVGIYSSSGSQLLHKFRSQLFVKLFGNVSQGILESYLRLLLCQAKSSVGSSPYALRKLRILGIFIVQPYRHG